MSQKLLGKLEEDFPGKLAVTTTPVDSSDGKPKVYKIELGGEVLFDWAMSPPAPPVVAAAPNDSWKTPINFETHAKFFGPGMGEEGGEAKQQMYAELKDAISAKLG
mmetsp:Transcript_67300/g.196763  ORF Transcript_67300/g.196763 Transcript_67300/m.196763 type:complete len:106 (+) Transcript_67300:124-441(+)